jgi:DNA-binding PucR family transcriptional regulator
MSRDQIVEIVKQVLTSQQQTQRQQVSSPANANIGAVTQMFNGPMNFNGINDIQSFFQALNALQGQGFEHAQRGAIFNY